MSSSQQPESSTSHRRQQRQDDRVAPYLTHVVAHHGQLTLIPPQNAGRIRKPTKKKKLPANRDRDRLDDEEPRFTTAVPPSSSRKLHPAPAHVRTRKHAISSPAPPSPSTSRRYDSIIDDQSIPDYPPPSFEDAIASPHVPPHLSSSVAHSSAYSSPSQSHDTLQSPAQALQPMTPSARSTPNSIPSTTLYDSPAVSQVSLVRSVDPHSLPPSPHARSLGPAPSPLALASTATLPSSPTVVSESTAFSDTPLLRPPQPRSVPHSSTIQPRERSPGAAPYRLTSPSTTTLLSPAHALRDSPIIPQVSPSRPTPELPSPIADSPPPSPHPQSRTSISTVSDVFEEFTWDPRQRWSADRRLGFSLEERVQREFERRNTQEALSALGGASSGTPVDPHTKRCSHCGSLRPLECGDIQSINEVSDEEDEEEDEGEHASRHSSSPRGKSPYQHSGFSQSKAMFMSRSQIRLKAHSPEPSSPPTSPLSPGTSFFKNPSAWASSVTLSLTNALGHNGHADKSATCSAPNTKSQTLKRKESFGVKRLFGSLKGKEREQHSRSQSLPNPVSGSTINLNASFVSSDSSSASESIDGWEVVSVEGDSVHSGHSTASTTQSTAPTSPARSIPEPCAPSPSSPTAEYRAAFINRPVRHRHSPVLESPATPTSPSPPALAPVPVMTTPVTAASPATATTHPFLPEKSPLRRFTSTGQPQQARIQTQFNATANATLPSPMTPSPLTSSPMSLTSPTGGTAPAIPRNVRPSPSVVWKTPSPTRSPLSQIPASGSPIRPSPLATPLAQTASISTIPHAVIPPTALGRLPPPVHPTIAALTRSEKTALRHQSAPLPALAMTMAMSIPHETTHPHGRSPTTDTNVNIPSSPIMEGHAYLRRRRAVTPPPSHRKAMVQLECDTSSAPVSSPLSDVVAGASPYGAVEEIPEPESIRECASIEQLMDESEARRGSSSPVSTPTTPTFSGGSGHQHYRGRPLPQLPPECEQESPMPVKRVPDGYPVNRLPEYPRPPAIPLPPSRTPSPSPVVSAAVVTLRPPPVNAPASAPSPSSPASASAAVAAALAVPAAPEVMERSTSGGSVLEEVRAEGEVDGPRGEFLQITDLDVLASRALDGAEDGRNYEDLLLVSEIVGPAATPASPAIGTTAPAEKLTVPFTGKVEVKRRRVLKDGRVKLKMSLLGVPVDRCGACLSQFRREEQGALTPVCKHSFHEVCLRRWLRTARVCPICRMALSMDD